MLTQTRTEGPGATRNAARDQLVADHLSLVHHVARRMHRTTGGQVDLDDLVSAGAVGLLEAAHAFDPDRGLAFATFAVPRIRGAMLDDLRAADPATRSVRSRQKAIRTATDSLGASLGREPSHLEVATAMGVDVETLWSWKQDADRAVPVSLEAPREGDGTSEYPAGTPDPDAEPLDCAFGNREEIGYVKEAILALADRHRVVLSLYYFEELTLRQIGQVIGVTESRVSQLRSEALRILRERLAPVG